MRPSASSVVARSVRPRTWTNSYTSAETSIREGVKIWDGLKLGELPSSDSLLTTDNARQTADSVLHTYVRQFTVALVVVEAVAGRRTGSLRIVDATSGLGATSANTMPASSGVV